MQYDNLYEGIDLVYYGNQGQLEYDLVVAPGADPSQIQLAFEGTDALSVNEAGDLVLHVEGGEVRLLQPHVYQMVGGKKVTVAANYVLGPSSPSSSLQETTFVIPAVPGRNLPGIHAKTDSGHQLAGKTKVDEADVTDISGSLPFVRGAEGGVEEQRRGKTYSVVGIHLAAYDQTRPLIIDPVLFFSSYLGGSEFDQIHSVTSDSSGDIYIVGETASTDFPTSNPLQAGLLGSSDAVIIKLASNGQSLLYATYLGGASGFVRGIGIDVDAAGNVYATGDTDSANFPVVNAFQPSRVGPGDTWVTKLNASGNALVYSTYLGGSSAGGEAPFGGIQVDAAGNVIVSGSTSSSDFPVLNAFQAISGGAEDVFVTKLNKAGNALVFSTYLGGTGQDQAFAQDVDSSGNIIIAGETNSLTFPTLNALDSTFNGVDDAFVAKLSPSGTLSFSTYLGGTTGNDDVADMVVDEAGDIYMSGGTTSTDFPICPQSPKPVFCESDTGMPFQSSHAGGTRDAFIAKLKGDGSTLVYSTYLGGNDVEGDSVNPHIAVDKAGNAYVFGNTLSLNFPTVTPIQSTFAGGGITFPGFGGDWYVSVLDSSGSTLKFSTFLGGSSDDWAFLGKGIALDAAGNIFLGGTTDSTDFPTTAPLQSNNAGGTFSGGGGPRDGAMAKICQDPLGSTPGTWNTVPMPGPREFHTTTLLPNGEVLLAGGADRALPSIVLNTAERFNFQTGLFSATGVMSSSRIIHTATGLSSGQVLLAGGVDSLFSDLSSAEIYDPAGSGTFSPTGSMQVARNDHQALRLPDGTVLVTGGLASGSALASTELYDPTTGTFSVIPPGPMTSPRNKHTMTLLADGTVLIVGGFTVNNNRDSTAFAEVFDPVLGTFTPTTGPLQTPRALHTATMLADGTVLIAGGINVQGISSTFLSSAELYDPQAKTFTVLPNAMTSTRMRATAVRLPDGRVVLAGGRGDGGVYLNSADLYDPITKKFTLADSLETAREDPQRSNGVLLPNGQVFLAGGQGEGVTSLDTAELYTPNVCGPEADLALTVTDSPDPAQLDTDSTIQLDVQVTNNGPDDANAAGDPDQVQTIITIPADLTLDAGSLPALCEHDIDPPGSLPGGVVTCDLGTVVNGAMPLRALSLLTAGAAPGIKTITTEVRLNGEFDPDFGTNVQTNATIVQSDATPDTDLILTITDTPDPVQLSPGTYSYTLNVDNMGTDVAIETVVTVEIPDGVTLDSTSFPGGSCSIDSGTGPLTTQCSIGDVDVMTATQVVLNVTATTVGSKTLTATAVSTGLNAVPDADEANNTNITETTAVGLSVFMVNSTLDGGDAVPGDGMCETATPSECTLRAAIQEANHANNSGLDVITFDISDPLVGGAHTIQPTSDLPVIVDSVVIDGTTEPDFAGSPVIELDGSTAGGSAFGLRINTGFNTVRGLVVNNFGSIGIFIQVGDGNVIAGNYIGTNVTGTIAEGNGLDGIRISTDAVPSWSSSNNIIGGTTPSDRNIISGNGNGGVNIFGQGATNNVVQGNYIGTDVTGTNALPNTTGGGMTIIDAPNNTIGGTAPGAGNVISGNNGGGVNITFPDATGNAVLGNLIGTDVTGTVALGNGSINSGVVIKSASGNTIGGLSAGARNIIAGNGGSGISIVVNVPAEGPAQNNVVQGNYIGTDITGTVDMGNGVHGVALNSADNNTIGGTSAGARNIISGNDTQGIGISGTSTGNLIQGNYIGTDLNGVSDLGNGLDGILLSNAPGNMIGGLVPEARNVISGNNRAGVNLSGALNTDNTIHGNYIGIAENGSTPLPNSDGVSVTGDATNNLIGGNTPEARNVISGNTQNGVVFNPSAGAGNMVKGNVIGLNAVGDGAVSNNVGILFSGSSGQVVGGLTAQEANVISGNTGDGVSLHLGATGHSIQGNFIGTGAAGIEALGNGSAGIQLSTDAANNIIGGLGGGGNTIAFNGTEGVVLLNVVGNVGNQILGNQVFENGSLGIDLGADGPTPNDPQDGDGSPNNFQNYPVLETATRVSGGTQVTGTFNSTPNSTFTLEFFSNAICDASGFGEGEKLVDALPGTPEFDALTVTTDSNGDGTISATIGGVVPGRWLTATATDATTNDTSEFSACIPVQTENRIYGTQSQTVPGHNTGLPAHLISFVPDDSNLPTSADLIDHGPIKYQGTDVFVDGLALSHTHGLVGFEGEGAPAPLTGMRLVRLDPITAEVMPIGVAFDPALTGLRGAVFDRDDQLWVVDTDTDEVLRIDPVTGQEIAGSRVALTVGGSPFDAEIAGDLAIQEDGTMYLVHVSTLYVLDPATGALTVAFTDTELDPDSGFPPAFTGLTFSTLAPPDRIFGTEGRGQDDVFSYDIDDGFARTEFLEHLIPAVEIGLSDLTAFTPVRVDITIDAAALTAPQIQVRQGSEIIGTLDTTPTNPVVPLTPGVYSLRSALTLEVTTTAGSIDFEVLPDGTLEYDSSLNSVLSGRGGSTLTVIGVPLTIDATDLVTPDFTPNFSMHGVVTTVPVGPAATPVMVLPGQNEFHMTGQIPNFGFFFDVPPDGLINLDGLDVDLKTYVTGDGTSTLTVTGVDITIDTSNLTAPDFGFKALGPGFPRFLEEYSYDSCRMGITSLRWWAIPLRDASISR